MAIANFFDKAALSASQVFNHFERELLEQKLIQQCIGIYFGGQAANSLEGKKTLELLTLMLSRFYPSIKFIDETDNHTSIINKLTGIAYAINPEIDIEKDRMETHRIVVGAVSPFTTEIPCFYIGSNGWNCFFSRQAPQTCGNTNNPFGAGGAACFALSALFQFIFQEELCQPPFEKDFSFSFFSQKINDILPVDSELPSTIHLSSPVIIGMGAIGNALLWGLIHLPNLAGEIILIDKENADLSNLQRYVLLYQDHVDKEKVQIAAGLLSGFKELKVRIKEGRWQEVASSLTKKELELLVVAIDNKPDRVLIQGALPKTILNAWTSPDCVGVSRHFDFINEVCLACLYLPRGKEKSESEKMAESLGIPTEERRVRYYLANRLPLDESFLQLFSSLRGLQIEQLLLYKGRTIQALYSELRCGSRLLHLDKNIENAELEVPMVQESVLAGLLLGAELIIQANSLRSHRIEPVTKINLSEGLHEYLLEEEEKHYTGKCICQDTVYREQYQKKWA